jgi:hypothetical protein
MQRACELGIVRYDGSFPAGSRQAREALRHRMRRYGVVVRYEHNIYFEISLGALVRSELASKDQAFGYYQDRDGATVYLKGFESKEATLVKLYDITPTNDKAAYERFGPRLKLEISFRKSTLRNQNVRKPSDLGTQPAIQERLHGSILRVLRSVFGDMMNNPRSAAMERFREVANERTNNATLVSLLSRDRTYYELTKRIAYLERMVAAHESRIVSLESAHERMVAAHERLERELKSAEKARK